MIPGFLIEKFGKAIATLIMVILLLLVFGGGYLLVKNHFTAGPEAQSKLNKAQGSATQQSGTDAVNTVGNVMASEAGTDDLTRSNADAIDKAQGSSDAVHPDARAAGVHALCSRPSYRQRHPECVQQPAAR